MVTWDVSSDSTFKPKGTQHHSRTSLSEYGVTSMTICVKKKKTGKKNNSNNATGHCTDVRPVKTVVSRARVQV